MRHSRLKALKVAFRRNIVRLFEKGEKFFNIILDLISNRLDPSFKRYRDLYFLM